MRKMLIIGVKGMAGHILHHYYKEGKRFEVYGIARNVNESENLFNLDVADTDRLKSIIVDNQFDFVVNCIGILNKDAEENPAKAIWFNSYFPHFLEELTRDSITKVIHISTDCVFSGKIGGYSEDDQKDGVGFYAQSKALGELINTKDLTVRTSIIGPELNNQGIGLFHWFMSQPKDVALKGYAKAYWSGITTLELAKVIDALLEQNITGLIQVSSKPKIDKYSLLQIFNTIYRNDHMKVDEYGDYEVDKSLISIRTDFKYELPTYEQMLIHQHEWLKDHPILYPHYNV